MKKQAHDKTFCPHCLYSAKGRFQVCPKCKNETIGISHKFHLPSMNASKAKWKKFFAESNFLNTGYQPMFTKLILETVNKIGKK